MTDLGEFSTLDWENDKILNTPTNLDFRIEQLFESIQPDTPCSAASDRMWSDEMNTPSTFSVETPSSILSEETPRSTASVDTTLLIDTETATVPVYQAKEPITTTSTPLPSLAPVTATSKLNSISTLQVKPRTILPAPPKALVPAWEHPEDKIKKYRSKQERYYTMREGYLSRYKHMKNLIRKQKATDEALPPREETIQLFSEVSLGLRLKRSIG